MTLFLILLVTSLLFLLFCSIYMIAAQRRYKMDLELSASPSCTLILPCKGSSEYFEKNITSFLSLEYSNYKLICVVESSDDKAYPILKRLTSDVSHADVVVAGKATKCCQKNHNLLVAISKAEKSDYLIFVDSDIYLSKSFIPSMIVPLERDSSLTATTGFRWLHPEKPSIGSFAHSYQNYMLFSLFAISTNLFNCGVWGGSTAMRWKDFDDLDVADRWAQTGVDDLALSELLQKKRRKIKLSYQAITPTTETLSTYSDSIKWYTRQCAYLKYYQKREWIASLLISTIIAVAYIVSTITTLKLLCGLSPSAVEVAVPASLITFLILHQTLLFFAGRSRWKILSLIASPLSLLSVLISVLKTPFLKSILWSGKEYFMEFKGGTVTSIKERGV